MFVVCHVMSYNPGCSASVRQHRLDKLDQESKEFVQLQVAKTNSCGTIWPFHSTRSSVEPFRLPLSFQMIPIVPEEVSVTSGGCLCVSVALNALTSNLYARGSDLGSFPIWPRVQLDVLFRCADQKQNFC